MFNMIERIMKKQKSKRMVSLLFVISLAVLYLTNLAIRIFVHQDSFWQLLWDFLPAVVMGASVYVSDWFHYDGAAALGKLKNWRLLQIFIPLTAALLSLLSYTPGYDRVDYAIVVYGVVSMCISIYTCKDLQSAYMTILWQTIAFMLLAVYLGSNVAAMVTFFLVGIVLICQAHRQHWRWRFDERKRGSRILALTALTLAGCLLILIPETGVLDAIDLVTRGRPGLGSSATVNRECTEVLLTAKFVGPISEDALTNGLLTNRGFTRLLAVGGWLAVLPSLLATVTVLVTGIWLCAKQTDNRAHCSAAFLTMMAVQFVGYGLMCAGWDELLFAEICPWLDGSSQVNNLFMMMAAWLLPPAEDLFPRLCVPEEYEEDDNETSEISDEELEELLKRLRSPKEEEPEEEEIPE